MQICIDYTRVLYRIVNILNLFLNLEAAVCFFTFFVAFISGLQDRNVSIC